MEPSSRKEHRRTVHPDSDFSHTQARYQSMRSGRCHADRRPAALPLLLNLALAALVLAPGPARAILERAGEHIHDAGALRLFVTNLGVLGNPTYPSFSDHPSLEWPAGTAQEFLLEAGLWIGARDRAGMVLGVSTAAPVSELRPSLAPVDRIYRTFDGAPGTKRLGSTRELDDADDDEDGLFDEEFLNGKDDDGDGLIDEDYVALGSQAFAREYRDDTDEARSQLLAHRPLGLKVQELSWVWSEGIPGLDRCVVIRYRIVNEMPGSLYDVYAGFYCDPDVGPKAHDGYWRDDRYSIETMSGTFPNRAEFPASGCETVPFERVVAIVEDAPDGTNGAAGGDVSGLIAACVLDHTTNFWGFRAPDEVGPSGIIHLAGRATFDRTREEIADVDKYALLARGTFDGDMRIDDHRFILSAGPYPELMPGAAIELTVALIVAEDRAALLESLTALEERYYGRWLDLDGSSFSGRPGFEACFTIADAPFCGFTPMQVDDDCDEPETKVRKHGGCLNTHIETRCIGQPENRCSPRAAVASTRCFYVNADCDPCTPNAIGGESHILWADTATRVSSRPVAKRFVTGDREVTIEWDNAAELPTARAVLPPVAGYRVWRAEGWTRPSGSSGPTSDEWRLVAELPLPRSGLPPSGYPFIVDGVEVIENVPGPDDSLYAHYAVGRYRYADTGILNGFAVFYDVTPFAVEAQPGGTLIARDLKPRASAGDELYPAAEANTAGDGSLIAVVPNPYEGAAEWDLAPNRLDPSGKKMTFVGLPPHPVTITIHTLAGDLVRTIEHQGGTGSADWDLLSRNGQPVATGIYLYTVEGPGLLHRDKLVIIR